MTEQNDAAESQAIKEAQDKMNKAITMVLYSQYSTLVGPVPLDKFFMLQRRNKTSLNVIKQIPTMDEMAQIQVRPLVQVKR